MLFIENGDGELSIDEVLDHAKKIFETPVEKLEKTDFKIK